MYAPLMLSICKRYLKNNTDAEDVLLKGMFKIFSNIGQFKGNGSFEGWMKRIVINEALMHLRKQKNFNVEVEISNVQIPNQIEIDEQLILEDLLRILDYLPTGYRTVFNLYVIEGYKHREIAEKLGISINTSKSQLILAKKRLRELLKKKQYPSTG
jgi:RNA polymerase sigma-70 factor (ECF subfamily)